MSARRKIVLKVIGTQSTGDEMLANTNSKKPLLIILRYLESAPFQHLNVASLIAELFAAQRWSVGWLVEL